MAALKLLLLFNVINDFKNNNGLNWVKIIYQAMINTSLIKTFKTTYIKFDIFIKLLDLY